MYLKVSALSKHSKKMKILLTTLEGAIFPVEVSSDLEVVNLKALCEQETNIPLSEMSLSFNGAFLEDDSKTLDAYSIKENDIVMVQKMIGKTKKKQAHDI
jgi:DNA damage-inducible protein 1